MKPLNIRLVSLALLSVGAAGCGGNSPPRNLADRAGSATSSAEATAVSKDKPSAAQSSVPMSSDVALLSHAEPLPHVDVFREYSKLPSTGSSTLVPGRNQSFQNNFDNGSMSAVDSLSSETRQILTEAIKAHETRMSVIANNLANANTVAFKRDQAILEDVSYRHIILPGTLDNAGQTTTTGISVGLGTRIASVQTDFTQGAFQETGRQLDVAIDGRGFFQVTDPASGQTLYSRAGNFSVNANGLLVAGSASTGRLVEPQISIPPDTIGIVINADGVVQVRQAGQEQLSQQGQLQIALFINPDGLLKLGENLYSQTDASGAPTVLNPGQQGLGVLRQNSLEASNVNPQEELLQWSATARTLRLLRRLVSMD